MADEPRQDGYFQHVSAVLGKVMGAITRDGTIAAAGRLGVDEIGMALKAFPDAIQGQEMGTIWSPTPGEIASARAPGPDTPLPSPSQIADNARSGGEDRGRDLGMGQGKWQDRLKRERGQTGSSGSSDAGAYDREEGRSLPDEQREQAKDQDRGGRSR